MLHAADPTAAVSLLTFAETADPDTVSVDLSTLLTTRLIVTGDSRTGKSRMMRQLFEQTYGRLPHFIIDPESDYASLREKFGYLLVGRGGELAADVATAGTLAKRLFGLRASAIFDLSDMRPLAQREYVAAFMIALMEVHQTEGHPTLVVVDEAHRFASESGREVSHDPLWDISSRGGKRGFCLVAVTPRLSEFSKSVAGGLQNRLIFRTTLDVDVDRAGKSLGFRKATDRDVLLKLPKGQCFAYGPAIRDSEQVFRVHGVERTETTHFDVTKGVRPAAPPAPAQIRELVAELRDVALAAQEERSELDRLRAKVAQLEQQLEHQVASRPTIDEAELQRRIESAVAEERAALAESYRSQLQAVLDHAAETLAAASADVRKGAERIVTAPILTPVRAVDVRPDASPSRNVMPRATPSSPSHNVTPRATAVAATNGSVNLKRGERRMMEVLAVRAADVTSRAQLGLLSGFTPSGGTFKNYVRTLLAAALIEADGDGYRITAKGRALVGTVPPLTDADVWAMWANAFKAGERVMMEALRAAYLAV